MPHRCSWRSACTSCESRGRARRDLEILIGRLAALGDLDVTLTTNGAAVLASKAEALAQAGLQLATASLDSPGRRGLPVMNDVDFPVARVLAGIDAPPARACR